MLEDASPSDRHLRKIGMHVSAYIAHVRTQLKQTIPKAIVHCLVSLMHCITLQREREEVGSPEEERLS